MNRLSRFLLFLLLALLVLSSGVVGALAGYRQGALQAQSTVRAVNDDAVYQQYKLALQDYQAGRYDLARQRLEYVIALRPDDYPDAWQYLTLSLQALNATATFTPAPPTLTATATPTLTPTRDLSGADSIFRRAQSLIAQRDWDGAIVALLALRDEDLYYRVTEVDDMFYTALRQRGEQRILQEGDLEGGIYDLSLAERFGPLDYQATVIRDWARLYLTAVGFWEAYPEQAVHYFGQLAAAVPGLHDASGLTAAWRYHWSLIHYGDKLAAEGDWCAAQAQYQQAFAYYSNATLEPTATTVAYRCSPPTHVPTATPILPSPTPTATLSPTASDSPTPTATGSVLPSSATPTVTATFTATPLPTETPFPTTTPSTTPLPSDTPLLPTDTPQPSATPSPLPSDTPLPPPTDTPLPPPTDTPLPPPTDTSAPAGTP